MTPVLHERSPDLPLFDLVVAFRGGAALDPPGRDGLANLVLRLVLRAPVGRRGRSFGQALGSLGAELAARVSTTALTLHVSALRRARSRVVDVLAEALACCAGRPPEPSALKAVVREADQDLAPEAEDDHLVCLRALRRGLLGPGHPLARSPSGTPDGLRASGAAEVGRQAARLLSRASLVLGWAGDVSVRAAARDSERLAAALPAAPPPDPPLALPPARPGRRLVFVERPDRAQVQVMVGTLAAPLDDRHHVALLAATAALDARLQRAVRDQRGWSYGTYAALPPESFRGPLLLWAHPAPERAGACVALLHALLAEWHGDGVRDDELTRAKQALLCAHAQERDSAARSLAQRLASVLAGAHDDRDGSDFVTRVTALSAADVRSALRARVQLDRAVTAASGPRCALPAIERALDENRDGCRLRSARGNAATGSAATGSAATGSAATGSAASGSAASGSAAIGRSAGRGVPRA